MGHIVKAAVPDPPGVPAAPAGSVEQLAALLVQARLEAKAAALVLARRMAEKIVGHAVAVDAEVMRDIARRALATVGLGRSEVRLRVHPEDLSALQGGRDGGGAALGATTDLSLVADASIGRGGCIVETATGRLDARLDVQLDALEQVLRRAGRS
jgi:flagellar assembly protein FliH